MEKYAVVMAGGSGTRLWPLSRESKPKQFVSVDGTKSFLAQTITRICEVIPAENCFVITNKDYFTLTKEEINGLIPVSNIIIEPLKRNTAACIAYASLFLEKKYGKSLVCFLPADSYVKNTDAYLDTMNQVYRTAGGSDKVIIVGVKPTYPSTGFGYIQIDEEDETGISKVIQFKEKPNLETAREYIKTDQYLWNSGMVAGELEVLTAGIQALMPEYYKSLSNALNNSDPSSALETAYSQLEDISFDYAFLEKCQNLYAVKGYFEWFDIGSLEALSILIGSDEHNNSIVGKHVGIDTENSTIYSMDSLITTIGLKDMVIIDMNGIIMVCKKERAQEVRELVRMLKKGGHGEFL